MTLVDVQKAETYLGSSIADTDIWVVRDVAPNKVTDFAQALQVFNSSMIGEKKLDRSCFSVLFVLFLYSAMYRSNHRWLLKFLCLCR